MSVAPEVAGAWEKHTRGIGSKILEKHGFKTRLGANETGITAPVQPVMRPRGVGLGAGGMSEKGERQLIGEEVKRREAQTRHMQRLQKRWKKEGVVVREVKKEKEKEEVRELLRNATADALFAAPEVVYNITMLAEAAVAETDRAKRRVATETLIGGTAQREVDAVKHEIQQARAAVQVLALVENLMGSLQKEEDDVSYCEGLTKFVSLVLTVNELRCMSVEVLRTALVGLVRKRVEKRLREVLAGDGKGRKWRVEKANHVRKVLLISRDGLSADDFLVLCTTCVLQPVRISLSRPSWDAVSGAWVADVLSEMRDVLPDVVVVEFAENVLVPKLVTRLDAELRGSSQAVPVHVWVHPWLPVVGRRLLAEVLGRVRVWLARRLERWRVQDVQERDELVDSVGIWGGALSRRKVQLALARHVTPKVMKQAGKVCGDQGLIRMETRPLAFENIERWSMVVSGRMLAAAIVVPIFGGLCRNLRNVVFEEVGQGREDRWKHGCELYIKWKAWIPGKLLPHMRDGLGALLFILYAARQADAKTRHSLKSADVEPLLRNRFTPTLKKEREVKRESRHGGEQRRSQASVKDMLLHVAHREGLVVVGEERRKNGLGVLRVGSVRVAVDGRRGVLLLVEGNENEGQMRVIGIEDLVHLAKGSLL